MRYIIVLQLFFVVFFPSQAMSQKVTDIYVADISFASVIEVGTPVNITNRDAYDNQPSFLPDGSALLYSSERGKGDLAQNDIYLYEFKHKKAVQLTDTANKREFSPQIMPGKKYMSAVRSNLDYSKSSLWKLELNGSKPELLLDEDLIYIGYNGWIDDKLTLLFTIPESGNELWLANIGTKKTQVIAKKPSHCMKRIPGEAAISYVNKDTSPWTIKRLSLPKLSDPSDIVETLEGSEDFEWTPDGTLLAAKGDSIYKYKPGKDKHWALVKKLDGFSQDMKIYRLALSPTGKKLAFVVSHGCMIEGQAFDDGDKNPKNKCQVCLRATSNHQWTTLPEQDCK